MEIFNLLHRAEVDMTLFFRALSDVASRTPDLAIFQDAFYDTTKQAAHAAAFSAWLERWASRVLSDNEPESLRRKRMHAINPRYVLRNYLAQQAIDSAERGDASMIHQLLEVLRHPYTDQPGREAFALKRPEWARQKPGCSMLSCSS